MDELIPLKIQSLVYGGYGLSRLTDGKAVFVPFVLPDEIAEVKILEEKKGYAIADLVNIKEPHSKRLLPRCVHYGKCGGCHYQHIPYDLQLKYKKNIFIEQLQRISRIENPIINEFSPSGQEWAYRNALQFNLAVNGKLSFADFSHNNPFRVLECHLPMQEINSFWPQIEFEPGSRIDRIELRQNGDGDLMMIMRGSDQELPEMETEAPVSIVHQGKADQVVMAGEDFIVMRIKGRDFKVSAGAFFQTNFESASDLVDVVVDAVSQFDCRSVMDVYCGVGLFSAFLAEQVDQIVGIETSLAACDDFAVNLDNYDNVSLYQGKAENILASINDDPDCVIVDPPRSGLKKETSLSIIAKSPRLLIYVSCNPSTLARDATHLIKSGYKLESSTLVDMFPQTFHIESVNIFTKMKSE